MIVQVIELTFLGLSIGVVAYVYAVILTERGMLLNGWYKLLQRLFGKYPLIFKPLIDCDRCVGGQMAMLYLLVQRRFYVDGITQQQILEHLFLVSITIIIITSLNKFYRWARN